MARPTDFHPVARFASATAASVSADGGSAVALAGISQNRARLGLRRTAGLVGAAAASISWPHLTQ